MKTYFNISFAFTAVILISACNDTSLQSVDKQQTTNSSKINTAYVLEKTATPTKWDPKGSVIVKFKHCVQGQPSNEAMIKMLYQAHVDEIEFDKETRADAKANNYSVSAPPVQTTSATLIETCPSGANATCDKGNVIEHYYTSSARILAEFEKTCGYSGSDTWVKFE